MLSNRITTPILVAVRRGSRRRDVHEVVGPELHGPVLDVGCGEGRLVPQLGSGVSWVGVDSSRGQTGGCPWRPLIRGDMRCLPFADDSFAEVVHLWCLYHLDDPVAAVREAWRVLQPGGRYYACTAARDNDPEIVPEGYPPTTFDAENGIDIVASVFSDARPERWDAGSSRSRRRTRSRVLPSQLDPRTARRDRRTSAMAHEASSPDPSNEVGRNPLITALSYPGVKYCLEERRSARPQPVVVARTTNSGSPMGNNDARRSLIGSPHPPARWK